jgi:hypothetical protein
MKSIRQGDVLLKPVEQIQGKVDCKGEKVLALGETTGHKHILRGDTTFYNHSGQVLVEVGEQGAKLIHEEHSNLEVPKGIYQVVIQREFTIQQGIQQVMD